MFTTYLGKGDFKLVMGKCSLIAPHARYNPDLQLINYSYFIDNLKTLVKV